MFSVFSIVSTLSRSRPERFAALMEHVPATGLDALAMTVPLDLPGGVMDFSGLKQQKMQFDMI